MSSGDALGERCQRVVARYYRLKGVPISRESLTFELQEGGVSAVDVDQLISETCDQGKIFETRPGLFRSLGAGEHA